MKSASLLGHVDEFVRIIRKSHKPADATLAELLRARKYIGSTERKFVSTLVFHTLRVLGWAEQLSHIDKSPSTVALYIALRELVPVSLSELYEKAIREAIDFSTIPAVEELLIDGAIPPCTQQWLLEETLSRWNDAEDVWRAMLSPAPLCLRVNTRLATRESVLTQLQQIGIDALPGQHSPAAIIIHERVNLTQHPLLLNGIVEVQDEGSQMIGLGTQVQPGMHVLDACAGAGGKTMHMADLMSDKGSIVARDVEPARLKETLYRAQRSGLRSVTTEITGTKSRHPSTFDVVLVDAPCSGLGTARRSPMVKWRLSPEQAIRHFDKQLMILTENANHVSDGGALVYATCSILPLENEDVVERFLDFHGNFTLEESQQTDPFHHGTDGLFWARLRKQ